MVIFRLGISKERNDRYGVVWNRLWKRALPVDGCKLGSEPRGGRDSRCTACPFRKLPEFDIDREIADLISDGTFRSSGTCPYEAFATALIAALSMGTAVTRSNWEAQHTLITGLETALRHINRALNAVVPSRDELRALTATWRNNHLADVAEEKTQDHYLADVVDAETLIGNALEFLKRPVKDWEGKEIPMPREMPLQQGRPADHDLLLMVRACGNQWEKLVGAQPGKNNVKYHGLLDAAATTIFGVRKHEPNWEWYIRAAKELRNKPRRKISSKK
jgi:hypothetical protein